MSSNIVLQACQNDMQLIKPSSDTKVSWKSAAIDRIETSIGCLQTLCDRSLTSMAASSSPFYPLHVTLLSFTETARQRYVMNGDTSVAHLPTKFDQSFPRHKIVQRSRNIRKSTIQLRTLKALYKSTELGLPPFQDITLKGSPYQKRQVNDVRFH